MIVNRLQPCNNSNNAVRIYFISKTEGVVIQIIRIHDDNFQQYIQPWTKVFGHTIFSVFLFTPQLADNLLNVRPQFRTTLDLLLYAFPKKTLIS